MLGDHRVWVAVAEIDHTARLDRTTSGPAHGDPQSVHRQVGTENLRCRRATEPTQNRSVGGGTAFGWTLEILGAAATAGRG